MVNLKLLSTLNTKQYQLVRRTPSLQACIEQVDGLVAQYHKAREFNSDDPSGPLSKLPIITLRGFHEDADTHSKNKIISSNSKKNNSLLDKYICDQDPNKKVSLSTKNTKEFIKGPLLKVVAIEMEIEPWMKNLRKTIVFFETRKVIPALRKRIVQDFKTIIQTIKANIKELKGIKSPEGLEVKTSVFFDLNQALHEHMGFVNAIVDTVSPSSIIEEIHTGLILLKGFKDAGNDIDIIPGKSEVDRGGKIHPDCIKIGQKIKECCYFYIAYGDQSVQYTCEAETDDFSKDQRNRMKDVLNCLMKWNIPYMESFFDLMAAKYVKGRNILKMDSQQFGFLMKLIEYKTAEEAEGKFDAFNKELKTVEHFLKLRQGQLSEETNSDEFINKVIPHANEPMILRIRGDRFMDTIVPPTKEPMYLRANFLKILSRYLTDRSFKPNEMMKKEINAAILICRGVRQRPYTRAILLVITLYNNLRNHSLKDILRYSTDQVIKSSEMVSGLIKEMKSASKQDKEELNSRLETPSKVLLDHVVAYHIHIPKIEGEESSLTTLASSLTQLFQQPVDTSSKAFFLICKIRLELSKELLSLIDPDFGRYADHVKLLVQLNKQLMSIMVGTEADKFKRNYQLNLKYVELILAEREGNDTNIQKLSPDVLSTVTDPNKKIKLYNIYLKSLARSLDNPNANTQLIQNEFDKVIKNAQEFISDNGIEENKDAKEVILLPLERQLSMLQSRVDKKGRHDPNFWFEHKNRCNQLLEDFAIVKKTFKQTLANDNTFKLMHSYVKHHAGLSNYNLGDYGEARKLYDSAIGMVWEIVNEDKRTEEIDNLLKDMLEPALTSFVFSNFDSHTDSLLDLLNDEENEEKIEKIKAFLGAISHIKEDHSIKNRDKINTTFCEYLKKYPDHILDKIVTRYFNPIIQKDSIVKAIEKCHNSNDIAQAKELMKFLKYVDTSLQHNLLSNIKIKVYHVILTDGKEKKTQLKQMLKDICEGYSHHSLSLHDRLELIDLYIKCLFIIESNHPPLEKKEIKWALKKIQGKKDHHKKRELARLYANYTKPTPARTTSHVELEPGDSKGAEDVPTPPDNEPNDLPGLTEDKQAAETIKHHNIKRLISLGMLDEALKEIESLDEEHQKSKSIQEFRAFVVKERSFLSVVKKAISDGNTHAAKPVIYSYREHKGWGNIVFELESLVEEKEKELKEVQRRLNVPKVRRRQSIQAQGKETNLEAVYQDIIDDIKAGSFEEANKKINVLERTDHHDKVVVNILKKRLKEAMPKKVTPENSVSPEKKAEVKETVEDMNVLEPDDVLSELPSKIMRLLENYGMEPPIKELDAAYTSLSEIKYEHFSKEMAIPTLVLLNYATYHGHDQQIWQCYFYIEIINQKYPASRDVTNGLYRQVQEALLKKDHKQADQQAQSIAHSNYLKWFNIIWRSWQWLHSNMPMCAYILAPHLEQFGLKIIKDDNTNLDVLSRLAHFYECNKDNDKAMFFANKVKESEGHKAEKAAETQDPPPVPVVAQVMYVPVFRIPLPSQQATPLFPEAPQLPVTFFGAAPK